MNEIRVTGILKVLIQISKCRSWSESIDQICELDFHNNVEIVFALISAPRSMRRRAIFSFDFSHAMCNGVCP